MSPLYRAQYQASGRKRWIKYTVLLSRVLHSPSCVAWEINTWWEVEGHWQGKTWRIRMILIREFHAKVLYASYLIKKTFNNSTASKNWCEMNDVTDAANGLSVTFLSFLYNNYFASMWDECNCVVVWAFFGIAFLWDWNENWPFPVLWPCWVFQICWHIECSTFTASSFMIWNSSAGIPSPPFHHLY